MNRKYFLASLLAFCSWTISCVKEHITLGSTFSVGQSYQGGKIFYIDSTSHHGLVAATEDQHLGIQWSDRLLVVAVNATSYTDGVFNTNQIITVQGNGSQYAANVCRLYNGGGYSDWYLPSRNELNLLYLQRKAIGNFSDLIGYWSSTEFSKTEAWVQTFKDGVVGISNKTTSEAVRAIRRF